MARRTSFEMIEPFDESFRRCAEWDYAVRAALIELILLQLIGR